MSIKIDTLTQAINTVENIHKVELKHLHHFFMYNEFEVVKVFSNLIKNPSIDERFLILDRAFPNLREDMPYLIEASIIVAQ